ncbi:MAG: transcriptional regulator [Rubrivivax sp.]|nr:MAG: transcriptional regulator [Rubrivivax sp.]
MRDRMDIEDATTAALLSRPALQQLMAVLIARDSTMAELARLSGMSYSLLSHHLKRLRERGVVVVSGHAARAGRPSPLYRAAARSYFIPSRWCTDLPGERMARELREALALAGGAQGVLLFEDDGARLQLVTAQPRTEATDLWLRLRLSATDARQFNDELRALFERWRGLQKPAGRTYLLHGACVRAPTG